MAEAVTQLPLVDVSPRKFVPADSDFTAWLNRKLDEARDGKYTEELFLQVQCHAEVVGVYWNPIEREWMVSAVFGVGVEQEYLDGYGPTLDGALSALIFALQETNPDA